MTALRELLARFDIGVDSSPLVKANAAIDGTKAALGAVGGLIGKVGAAWGAKTFVSGLISTGTEIGKASAKLGMSAHDVQSWSYVTGLALDDFTISAKFLQNSLDGAAEGSKSAVTAFARLGVKAKDSDGKTRSFGEVLPDIAEKFSAITDPAEQTALALDIFGRGGMAMIPVLKKGREGVEELRAQFDRMGGGFSAKAVEGAKKTAKAIKDLKLQMTSIRGQIAEALLPPLAVAVRWFGNLTGAALEATRGTEVFKVAAVAAGLLLAKAFLPVLAEWALPIAVVAALILVIEDLVGLCQGRKSAIGDFLDEWQGAGTAAAFAESLREAIHAVGEAIVWTADQWKNLGSFFSKDLPEAYRLWAGLDHIARPDQDTVRPEDDSFAARTEANLENTRRQRDISDNTPRIIQTAKTAIDPFAGGTGVREGRPKAVAPPAQPTLGALGIQESVPHNPLEPLPENKEDLSRYLVQKYRKPAIDPNATGTGVRENPVPVRPIVPVPEVRPVISAPPAAPAAAPVTVNQNPSTTVNITTTDPRAAERKMREIVRDENANMLRDAMAAVTRS
jgi:hypothetical protein